jgi:hypothetical protein
VLWKPNLTLLQKRGDADVTEIRITAVQREQKRRGEEKQRTQILQRKGKDCNDASSKLDDQIKEAWEKSLSMATKVASPHYLHQVCPNL